MPSPIAEHSHPDLEAPPRNARSRGIVHRVAAESRGRFGLRIDGIHGVSRWSRVLGHGTEIAFRLDVDPHPVRLDALLHDCFREGDDDDLLLIHAKLSGPDAGYLGMFERYSGLSRQSASRSGGRRSAPLSGNYVAAAPEGRASLERVAEAEARIGTMAVERPDRAPRRAR